MQLSDEIISKRECCNNCINYEPTIKTGRLVKRGHCKIGKRPYKQRTETCQKFDRG